MEPETIQKAADEYLAGLRRMTDRELYAERERAYRREANWVAHEITKVLANRRFAARRKR